MTANLDANASQRAYPQKSLARVTWLADFLDVPLLWCQEPKPSLLTQVLDRRETEMELMELKMFVAVL